MNHRCMKCDVEIAYDVDVYTLFCDACLRNAHADSAERTRRIEAGDTTVPNMTKDERTKILDIRTSQRDAITD